MKKYLLMAAGVVSLLLITIVTVKVSSGKFYSYPDFTKMNLYYIQGELFNLSYVELNWLKQPYNLSNAEIKKFENFFNPLLESYVKNEIFE